MVKQEDFDVEQFMDKYETNIVNNMGETCCDSLSVNQLLELISKEKPEVDISLKRKQICDLILDTKATYGHIRGSPDLKSAIAAIYNEDLKTEGISNDNIVVTNGAIGANFLTLYSLVDANDKVIVVSPTYQQLGSVSAVFSQSKVNVIPFELKYENEYLPDLVELKQLIETHFPKLVIINNPNNPTGVVWDNETMEKMVNLCKSKDVWLMCDEVYRPLYHSVKREDQPKSVVNYGYAKTISTGSTSKAFAFAGLRLGWVVTRDKALLDNLFSKRDYNTISVSMVDDSLATLVLQNHKVILKRNYDICLKNIEIVQKEIDHSNGLLSWIRPKSGTTCFIKINIPNLDTYKLCSELAEQHNTLVVPGEVFDNRAGFLRVGFGNSPESIVGGFYELKNGLSKMVTKNNQSFSME